MDNNVQTPVTQTEDKTVTVDAQTTSKNEPKLFTQEEVNALILKTENKINKKYEGINVTEYNEWKEKQKTETDKQIELTQKMTDTTNENVSLRQENHVLKSGVNVEDVDYVVYKVSKMEGEFEDNLKEFLKENPKYLHTKDTVESPQTTGVAVTKINENAESGVSSILKAKHPDLFK